MCGVLAAARPVYLRDISPPDRKLTWRRPPARERMWPVCTAPVPEAPAVDRLDLGLWARRCGRRAPSGATWLASGRASWAGGRKTTCRITWGPSSSYIVALDTTWPCSPRGPSTAPGNPTTDMVRGSAGGSHWVNVHSLASSSRVSLSLQLLLVDAHS